MATEKKKNELLERRAHRAAASQDKQSAKSQSKCTPGVKTIRKFTKCNMAEFVVDDKVMEDDECEEDESESEDELEIDEDFESSDESDVDANETQI